MSTEDKPARLKFCKGYTINGFSDKVYHLHLRNSGDWDELYFRDYLLEHSNVANEYGVLKKKLLVRLEHDRDGYTDEKSDFVLKYTAKAREKYKDRYKP